MKLILHDERSLVLVLESTSQKLKVNLNSTMKHDKFRFEAAVRESHMPLEGRLQP